MGEPDEVVSLEDLKDIRGRMIFESLFHDEGYESPATLTSGQNFDIILYFHIIELGQNLKRDIREAQNESSEDMDEILEEVSEELDISKEEMLEDEFTNNISDMYKRAEILNRFSGEIIEFVVFSNLIIEHYSTNLLDLELISEEYQGTNKTEKLLSRRLSQQEREDLLLRTGIIDAGMKGKLTDVRNTRNSLVHDIENSVILKEVDNTISVIDYTINVIKDMRDILSEDDGIEVRIENN